MPDLQELEKVVLGIQDFEAQGFIRMDTLCLSNEALGKLGFKRHMQAAGSDAVSLFLPEGVQIVRELVSGHTENFQKVWLDRWWLNGDLIAPPRTVEEVQDLIKSAEGETK